MGPDGGLESAIGLYSVCVRDPQTVDCGDSRLKLKAGRAHYRDRSTGSEHLKVWRAHYWNSSRYA